MAYVNDTRVIDNTICPVCGSTIADNQGIIARVSATSGITHPSETGDQDFAVCTESCVATAMRDPARYREAARHNRKA